jgi:hypothetical protein
MVDRRAERNQVVRTLEAELAKEEQQIAELERAAPIIDQRPPRKAHLSAKGIRDKDDNC